ncbi:MAG: hypothetical protein CSA74_00910 [Rhodobacterales bacterium]|nr:MAG: hypothetical protein CSA74_00910 [Rhodobacterales bacterium]
MHSLVPASFAAFALGVAMTALPAVAETAGAANTAGGTGWILVSVGGAAARPGGRIVFSADGTVFGTTGCNHFNGTAVSAPGTVVFKPPLATTMMLCPEPMDAQETRVLEALDGTVAVAYDPAHDQMTLIPGNGASELGFVRFTE